MVVAQMGYTFPGCQVFSFADQIFHEDGVDTFDANSDRKHGYQRNTIAHGKVTR
jgi:hypothetical protein